MSPMNSPDHHHHGQDHGIPVVRDPVCGMTVDPHTGKPTAEHDGRTFHFCSAGCKAKFEKNPGQYAK